MLRHPRFALGPLADRDRLRSTPRLQRIVTRVTEAGPRPVGEMLVELLELAKADPAVLDRLDHWERIDPRIVRQVGGDRFPCPPLDLVPQERKR